MIGNLVEKVSSGVILHQVNAQGVMGSGIAKELRLTYPQIWEDYSAEIKPYPPDEISARHLGKVIITEVRHGLFVSSLVGQQFYGASGPRYTSYDALDVALLELRSGLLSLIEPPPVVHYPLIGAGLGGGHWPVIKEILNHRLNGLEHHLWLLPGSIEPK